MRKFPLIVAFLAFQTVVPQQALAGPYADGLSKCLVEATSPSDRTALVRWMFTAAALHPAVKPISDVTDAQVDDANKIVADLVMRLLTESCRAETESALQHEGATTIETSFMVLGQVAGQELFASPDVAAGLAGLEKHFDESKLSSLKGIN